MSGLQSHDARKEVFSKRRCVPLSTPLLEQKAMYGVFRQNGTCPLQPVNQVTTRGHVNTITSRVVGAHVLSTPIFFNLNSTPLLLHASKISDYCFLSSWLLRGHVSCLLPPLPAIHSTCSVTIPQSVYSPALSCAVYLLKDVPESSREHKTLMEPQQPAPDCTEHAAYCLLVLRGEVILQQPEVQRQHHKLLGIKLPLKHWTKLHWLFVNSV